MNRRVSHIYKHTLIYTCLPSSDRSAGNTRRIRELESIYRIYTASVTLLPNGLRSVQSNFMICIHLASHAPDLPLVVSVIVLFSLFFLLGYPSAFTMCRFYRKKGEWLRKSITSIHAPSVFNSLIVPTFTSHWSLHENDIQVQPFDLREVLISLSNRFCILKQYNNWNFIFSLLSRFFALLIMCIARILVTINFKSY